MKKLIILIALLFIKLTTFAQAHIDIQNNSMRNMTVKVMRANGGKCRVFKIVTISPYSSETVYFSNSGKYFTKTKAVLKGKTPVCRKGDTFNVVNDDTGYSVLTLTFTITESTAPQASGGMLISESEFNAN
jgi:hypothetical protein